MNLVKTCHRDTEDTEIGGDSTILSVLSVVSVLSVPLWPIHLWYLQSSHEALGAFLFDPGRRQAIGRAECVRARKRVQPAMRLVRYPLCKLVARRGRCAGR